MSEATLVEVHSVSEIDNFRQTESVLDGWLTTPWPSSTVLPEIHKRLLYGVDDYRGKGIVEREPGEIRKEDLTVSGEPENFYVRGTDVSPVLGEYLRDLDSVLQQLPETPDDHIGDIVKGAAWAYYTFGRIHPFLDGNGRTGRIVLNRVLMGAGFERLIFLDTWFSQERELHLTALNLVDKLGILAPLELYLLHSLRSQDQNQHRLVEIDDQIAQKEKEVIEAKGSHDFSQIWPVFDRLDLAAPRNDI